MNEAATVRAVLAMPVWAFVGLAPDRHRTAYEIAEFLQRQGRRIVPIHPGGEEALGEPGYRSLGEIAFPVDVVAVYRRSTFVAETVDAAIAIGARAVWCPLGVGDGGAAERAEAAGLAVVMDRCPTIEWPRYGESDAAGPDASGA